MGISTGGVNHTRSSNAPFVLIYKMGKKIHKVIHRKLGREGGENGAWGLSSGNLIEIDERLKTYRYLLYMLHEHFHIKHPDWSETKVRKESSLTARFLWQNNFRWVDLK